MCSEIFCAQRRIVQWLFYCITLPRNFHVFICNFPLLFWKPHFKVSSKLSTWFIKPVSQFIDRFARFKVCSMFPRRCFHHIHHVTPGGFAAAAVSRSWFKSWILTPELVIHYWFMWIVETECALTLCVNCTDSSPLMVEFCTGRRQTFKNFLASITVWCFSVNLANQQLLLLVVHHSGSLPLTIINIPHLSVCQSDSAGVNPPCVSHSF